MSKTSSRTILLSQSKGKWSLVISGALSVLSGMLQVSKGMAEPFYFTAGIFLILGGFVVIVAGFLSTSVSSRFAPKVLIDEEMVLIKPSIFSKPNQYMWNEVSKIELGHYRIGFYNLDNKVEFISYHTDAESSKLIKSLIRSKREEMGIPID